MSIFSARLAPVTGLALAALAAQVLSPLTPAVIAAAPAADSVFTDETVAFFSIADPDDFEDRWNRTQIGQFTKDASLEPFVKQIREKLIDRFGNIEERLGMTLDDVTAAAGGEAGVGMMHRDGERASIAVVIDTTDKNDQADQLIAKAEAQLAKRGGTRSLSDHRGTELVVFSMPESEKRRVARQIVRFRHGDLLVAVDSLEYANEMVDLLSGGEGETLKELEPYAETMKRCAAEARGMAPNVRWYTSPFAWDRARRTLHEKTVLAERKDTLTILSEQGFDAIRGIGGHIYLAATAERDIVHRTAVFAPPKPGTKGKSAAEKYELGMRMAEFPNRRGMDIQAWAPRMTATYTTANLDILNAYDHVSTLFDAMSGYDGAFDSTISSFEDDPYGPELDVRGQLVENLGRRITMMTDYKLPITTDCERYLIVLEVNNPDLLRSPIDKLMENDGALRKTVNGVDYWEIVPEDETLTAADLPDDLLSIDDVEPEVEETDEGSERILRRAAVCLRDRELIVASDVEFLQQVLFGVEDRESLRGSLDYQEAMTHLGELASTERCSWSFYRTDESIRPSYELIRQGLMPQSQTFFGRFLNELLTTKEDEEQGIVRKQRVDGAELPTFELARRYFGPAARAIRTDDDGWFVTGVVLSKAGQ